MRLLEYQAKALFSKYGIPVPEGALVKDLEEAKQFCLLHGYPVVLKAQLPIGGRGKAGAILKSSGDEELRESWLKLKGRTFNGLQVESVLVEPFLEHRSEFYASFFENRGERCFSMIVAPAGGVDVEQISEKHMSNFGLEGPSEEQYISAARSLSLPPGQEGELRELLKKLYTLFDSSEAELAEVNPLAYTGDSFIALDAKVVLDDNALFRRPELKPFLPKDPTEEEAERYGFNFVPLDGNVAVVGNGAGLVLATLDMVSARGISPACFLDLGGGASPERVQAALRFLTDSLPKMNLLFINVFGGITNSVSVAEGFLECRKQGILSKPFFLRLSGSGEIEARELLRRNGIDSYIDVEDALDALERSIRG
jgi:succinyl-CoA synthetase beta subunit